MTCSTSAMNGTKIHDRYCHGLSASRASHRRTVAAEPDSATPWVTASRASSGEHPSVASLYRALATDADQLAAGA